jgi:hypothetical protein
MFKPISLPVNPPEKLTYAQFRQLTLSANRGLNSLFTEQQDKQKLSIIERSPQISK